jgi:hypothetical protein
MSELTRSLQLAERLKAYLEWSGWYGTSPEPQTYRRETLASDRPLDARNTVVKIIESYDASLRQQLDDSMRRQETLAANVNAGLLEIQQLRQQLAEREQRIKYSEREP